MPRNPNKTPCSVPDCRAWAIRGSDPPRCSAHTPGKVGAPPGNRQVRAYGPHTLTHGFYASTLDPDDLAVLEEGAIDTSLDEEIFIVRLAIRRMQLLIVTGTTPGPRPQRLDVHDNARFIGLTFQGANTLSRLLRVRHDLPGNDPFMEVMNQALDNLSEEWGIEL